MNVPLSLLAGAAGLALLASCDGEEPDACVGEACKNTTLELVIDDAIGSDSRACTVVLSTPPEAMWAAHAGVRAALERQGRRVAISAVQASGGVLPATVGEIQVHEEEADTVEIVRVECFDESGAAVESAGASLRRPAP